MLQISLLIMVLWILFFIYLYYIKQDSITDSKKSRFWKFWLPYKKKQYFFHPSEKEFYTTLVQVLQTKYNNQYVVFCNTRVIDLLYVTMNNKYYKKRYERTIIPRHVDYVICDTTNYSPILVIELNWTSHQENDVISRDTLKQEIFASAKLPLVVYSWEHADFYKIESLISPYLS